MSWRRFEAAAPNELWQGDHSDWLITGGVVQILSFLDDHSRLACTSRVWPTVTTEAVVTTFCEATARWGTPTGQLTDNGLCFSGKLRGIEVGFEIHLRQLGVRAITSRPFHPQTCGKVERFQQTMKKWLHHRQHRLGRLAADINELQAWIDEFIDYYNTQRPHRGIGRIPPIQRWNATPAATITHGAIPAPPSHSPPTTAASSATAAGRSCSASPTTTNTSASTPTPPTTPTSTPAPPSSAASTSTPPAATSAPAPPDTYPAPSAMSRDIPVSDVARHNSVQ